MQMPVLPCFSLKRYAVILREGTVMSDKIVSLTRRADQALEKALQQKDSIIAEFQEITGDTIELPTYAGLPVFCACTRKGQVSS